MKILLKDVLVVTQNQSREIFHGSVLIEDGFIREVSEGSIDANPETVISGKYAVLPGFINLHTHVAMSIFKGMGDDVPLDKFLEITFTLDARRDAEDIHAGAMLGIAEMLHSGITTFVDFYYSEDVIARAAEKAGIRSVLCWCTLDEEFTTQRGKPLQNAETFIREHRGKPLIIPGVAVQGVYVASDETWLKAREIAEKYGTVCTYHLAETKKEVYEFAKTGRGRPCEHLEKIGFLSQNQIAVHCCYLLRKEIKALAKNGVSVAHCPASNMKLASGVAPVSAMVEEGINTGIGTDSNASNNTLDIVREARIAGLLQKVMFGNPALLPAQTLLDMITVNGAAALGMKNKIGSIETGKRADLVVFNLEHPSLAPADRGNIVPGIVYSASQGAVEYVIVDGEIRVEHGRVNGEEKIVEAAENARRKFPGVFKSG
ncbi:MAG: amidohydrolase family protein [Thermoplasmata archaeon]|nr:amidohydrolase family protein [Thermoplasmata archaeon]